MKTIRVILPVIAFMMAIAAAFATGSAREESAVANVLYRDIGSGQCVQCDAQPSNPDQCKATNTHVICMCDSQDALNSSCNPTFRQP